MISKSFKHFNKMYLYSLAYLNLLLFIFAAYTPHEVVNFIILAETTRILYYGGIYDFYIFAGLFFGEMLLLTSSILGYLAYTYEPNTF